MYKCKLRVIFAEREIKQNEFSKKAGISNTTLSSIVNGRMPTFEVALRIGEALGLPVEQIWVKGEDGGNHAPNAEFNTRNIDGL